MMESLIEEITDIAMEYFRFMDADDRMTETMAEYLVRSVVDNYKNLRDYPPSYTDEMIEEDAVRWLSPRKNWIGIEVVPEVYARMGAEGMSQVTDAGKTMIYIRKILLTDVVPVCEVV